MKAVYLYRFLREAHLVRVESFNAMCLAPGSHLGPYEILALIGRGAMGEVYRARDTRLDRQVALKVLPAAFSGDPERSRRFEREARAISALNHPNICTIYDVGPGYFVMEYLEGETLAECIKNGPLPPERVQKIGDEVAGALKAAHGRGIIHRDLKPANIMLTETGAKLLDFGVAKLQRVAADEQTATMMFTSPGAIIGTLQYMSPEQLEGQDADARSDIFAFGAVLYEMLAGQPAFQGQSTASIIRAITRDEPKPFRELDNDVPIELQHIVLRCLRKARDERYASLGEVELQFENYRALTSSSNGFNFGALLRKGRSPRVAVPILLVLLLLGSLLAWWIERSFKVQWARTRALPEIARLDEQDKNAEAYALAVEAERYIPDDPMLMKLWPDISWLASIRTTPPGAAVYRRDYNASDSTWEFVGRSPIEKRRMPPVNSLWKLELKGFATVECATFPTFPGGPLIVTMDQEAKAPPGMVHRIMGGPSTPVTLFGLPGFEDLPAVPLGDYWIDRYEVTNKQFKEFLDQGGYRKHEYWKHAFRKDGRLLSWADATALFQDKTGRPGPATWVQGDYPHGQDDFPVTGVSWYEAAAYAEFGGKMLPTIYHWTLAASPWASAGMVPASNFGGQGPAPVGTYQGMSRFGVYDMAGNVKEWCWNEANLGRHYIMGGAWNEPTYMFNDADARSPFERSANFGFRCAKYVLTGETAKAADPVTRQARDFSREKPVSDQLSQVYKSIYSYDHTPLQAVVESTEQTDDWKKEKISIAAAYGNERIIAYIFLPRKVSPPFQTVVYFPGANAIRSRSSANDPQVDMYDFVIKSGRAVMFPIYKGTFERGNDLKSAHPNTTVAFRDRVVAESKDLGRSIDYLETRPDIDRSKVAYEGTSWGAAMGALLPAVEDRIRVCVLISPGFYFQRCLPEVDQLNFAPRVKVPVLMLNGRFDYIFPGQTSQEPMFRLLGAPKQLKRRVVYECGHDIPRNELIKETLNWLDRYLGPVK